LHAESRRPRETDRLGLLVGLGEEAADPRSLGLLGEPLRLGIRPGGWRGRVRRRAGVQDRLAEVAGQRRPERRDLPREAGVVLG